MHLTVSLRNSQKVCIATMRGELKLGPSLAQQCRRVASGLDGSDVDAVVIEMSGVTQIDSAGVGELVLIYSAAAERNRPVAIANAPKRVLEVLRVSRIDSMFQCFASEEQAVEALRQSRS